MTNRKQKVEDLMESFQSLRRSMAYQRAGTAGAPGITRSQWGVLMMLEGRGESSVKEVARVLGMSSSAATQLINRLVARGYVTRDEYARDRRKVTLTLSPQARKRVKKMKAEGVQYFLTLFGVLSDAEFNQFILLNKKIIERFLNT